MPAKLAPEAADIFTRLAAAGRNQRELADAIGIDQNKVTKVKGGERRFTAGEVLSAREWLGGLNALPAKLPDQPPTRSIDAGEIVEITRLDLSLPMGPGATVDDFVEGEPLQFDLGYVRTFSRTPPHRLRLADGAGDSMFPTLVPNDLVWIDTTQNQLLHADRIYAASINGGAAIKRLRPVAGGARVLVVSDNKTVDAYEVDKADVVIWGRVIRFARDL